MTTPPSNNAEQRGPSPRVLRRIRRAAHVCLLITLAVTITLGYLHFRSDEPFAKVEIGVALTEEGLNIEKKPPPELHFWQLAPYDETVQLHFAHLLAGRAGSVGWGLDKGFGRLYLLFQISMFDIILMLYLYPLFVTGFQHVIHVPVMGKMLSSAHDLALRHKARMEPYGAVGLMLFVLFPFWSTGPLVGVVIGYLIGLRTWVTFTVVTAGHVLAVGAWIYFYDWLIERNRNLALLLLVLVFGFVLAGWLYGLIRKRLKRQAPQDAPAATDTVHPNAASDGDSGVAGRRTTPSDTVAVSSQATTTPAKDRPRPSR